jgi:hypothetical protein
MTFKVPKYFFVKQHYGIADKRRPSLPAVVFNEGGNKDAELYQQLFIY